MVNCVKVHCLRCMFLYAYMSMFYVCVYERFFCVHAYPYVHITYRSFYMHVCLQRVHMLRKSPVAVVTPHLARYFCA